ncbi:aminoacyl-tRNA deacylase [Patescibacteria group bacterium]
MGVIKAINPKESSDGLYQKLIKLLKNEKINYQQFEHKPVFTSQEAAKVRKTKIEQGAKALVMLADKKPILLVLSAAKNVDSHQFKKLFKIKDLRMATENEVKKFTGVEIGAVPPFGNLMDLEVYADQSLGKNKKIVFSAGLHTKSIRMLFKDWSDITGPRFATFSK